MTDADEHRRRERLTPRERTAASIAAVVLLVIAGWMIVDPPDRTVALEGCKSAADSCLVTVDGDLTTIATAVFALAAAAGLIGLLGVRFTSVKAGGVELSEEYDEKTAGLPTAAQQQSLGADEERGNDTQDSESPVRVDVRRRLVPDRDVPVAVVSLELSYEGESGKVPARLSGGPAHRSERLVSDAPPGPRQESAPGVLGRYQGDAP
jgi:hypothetical protein